MSPRQWVSDWNTPDLATKQNLIAAAKQKAPEACIAAVMRDEFHTRVLEDLSLSQLRALCFTLTQRKKIWNEAAEPVETAF